MPINTIETVDQLRGFIGRPVHTDWQPLTQAMIDLFAQATNDHQWIHVDPERARRESPFGAPIAHGFLSMSLLAAMLYEAFDLERLGFGVNYGFNRLRFVAPVAAGTRVRARFVLKDVELLAAAAGQGAGVHMVWDVALEREGEARPALIAEWLGRRYAQ